MILKFGIHVLTSVDLCVFTFKLLTYVHVSSKSGRCMA
jgi:hypothetical protein